MFHLGPVASPASQPGRLLTKEHIAVVAGGRYCGTEAWHGKQAVSGAMKIASKIALKTMDAMVIGAAFVGSMATAFVVQKALLGAMFRAFERDKAKRR